MSEPEARTAEEQDKVEVPIIEAEPATPAENSDDMDAVLDRLLGIDSPEKPREVPHEPEPAPADPDLDRALKALQRDGVPSDVIESMSSSPSKVKEWGLKAAKRQADVDSYASKLAESRKKADDPGVPDAKPESSAESRDLEADADPLSEFGNLFGDEAAKPLRRMAESLRSEFEARTREMRIRSDAAVAYARIVPEYGTSAPDFDSVSEAAAELARERPGSFSSIEEMYREAFKRRAVPARKPDVRNVARPNVGRAPARPVREIDREDAVLDVLLSGGTRSDALRSISR